VCARLCSSACIDWTDPPHPHLDTGLVMMIVFPRETSRHQDSAGTAPSGTPPPAQQPLPPQTRGTQSHSAPTPLKRAMLTAEGWPVPCGRRLSRRCGNFPLVVECMLCGCACVVCVVSQKGVLPTILISALILVLWAMLPPG